MSEQAVPAAEVPEFTGSLEQLERDVSAISADGSSIWSAGTKVDAAFRGLSSYYQAPEAEQLFAVTAPVATGANEFCDELESVAQALGAYAGEVRPLVQKLERLKGEAADFESRIAGDGEWAYDDALIDENNARRSEINAAYVAFQAAELACANKIYALFSDFRFVPDNGDDKRADNEYGYSADMLDDAEGLPWGDRLDESIHWYELHRQVKHFVWDGLIVDFGWGTIRGIGTLFGADGFDAALGAWENLGKVIAGVSLLVSPMALPYLATPDKYMPEHLRESRTALKEAGKAMVSWDQWGKDNARAAGATFGNVITTIFTGGAGAAVKGGAIARGISLAGKTARFIDPMTHVVHAAGVGVRFGAVKLGDALANLRMLSNGEYLRIGEGAYRLDNTPGARAEAAAFPPEKFEKLVDFEGNTIYAPKAGGEWLNPDGTLYKGKPAIAEAAHTQRAATGQEAVPPREPALVGAGARTGEVTAHARDGLEPGAARGPGDDAGSARDLASGRNVDSGSGQRAGRGPDNGNNGIPARSGGTGGALDGPGHGGNDALGDAGRAGDESDLPGGQADTDAGAVDNGQQPPRERTAEEQKKIIEEQIKKANDPDQTWFERNYRSDGHRRSIKTLDENGDELPILAKDSDGGWIAKDSLPPKPGAKGTLDPRSPFTRDSVPDGQMGHLDEAASNRKVSNALTQAEQAYKKDPSAENLVELNKAQDAFDAQMPGRPNNSSIAEALGEQAAMRHVIPQAFKGAQWIDLPKTANGANMFDQLYRLDDGTLVIAEAKAPKANPIWRKGAGDAEGWMVQQGTRPYIETILSQMERSGSLVAKDSAGNPVLDATGKPVTNSDIARQISDALDAGKLKYVMVKAAENPGTYAGAKLEHFDIG
ncbi:hypothetical protein ABZ532_03380 [Streptomyces sp. NPDC019396]|uniref:hypothetical protein n=1 Tax=Streptomyces sp. NPDC019396 TaxID=3154687 RepID=UPI00341042EB